jgi:N-carbamoyl-L-amino-acid hydrolase
MDHLWEESVQLLRIDEYRFREAFEDLSGFGRTSDGGVCRPALSEAHMTARRHFHDLAKASRLKVAVDGAANHSVILEQPGASKTLLLGSHLDSVPSGGRFDGALGVMAGLEVLRTLKQSKVELKHNVEVIDFTDEESQLIECLGSRALIGDISEEDFRDPRCGRAKLEQAFAGAGISERSVLAARRNPANISGYLELHIEQGPFLETRGVQIGVVTGIVGLRTFRFRFLGQQGHAGTTPMADRRDAGRGASAFLLQASDRVEALYPGSVVTIGRLEFSPGVTCIIPGQADLYLEFRSLEEERLGEIERELLALAEEQASRFRLSVEIQSVSSVAPAEMQPSFRKAIHEAAEELGLSYVDMPSGAGHDAQLLSRIAPAGMIFIPSTGGSHNPDEFARWEDCVNGANILLAAASRIAQMSA